MTFLIIYLVSVLLNFFVVFPMTSKYLDKEPIDQHNANAFVFISLISICLPIIIGIILLSETKFVKNFSLANFLNKLWRIK